MNNYEIKNKDTAIIGFNGKYSFLSNFYEGNSFTYRTYEFNNSEAAFQSQKCSSRVKEFEMLSPLQSRRLGRQVTLIKNWDEMKDYIMLEVCMAKFNQDKELKRKLLSTGDRELVEGNRHGDKCWGMVYENGEWIGENRLGIVLMYLRAMLKE